jgi:rod shape-determining protein MreD
LFVAILQTSVLPSFALAGVMPELMLLVVVSISLLRGTRSGLLWALCGGLLLDLLSGGPFGTATISLALSSILVGAAQLNVLHDVLWLPWVASMLATAVYGLSYWVILQVTGRSMPWLSSLLQVIIPGMIVNALAIYPTYWVMRRVLGHGSTQSTRS